MSRTSTSINTYKVTTDGVPGFRLVRAKGRQPARNHVATETINVELASCEDGIEAGRLGIQVEDATAAPESQDATETEG